MGNVVNFPRTSPTGAGFDLAQATLVGVVQAASSEILGFANELMQARNAGDLKAAVTKMNEVMHGHAAGTAALCDAVKNWR